MTAQSPIGEVDSRFSSEGAEPTPWYVAREQLETAEIYWLTTVRRDGRPHVTPVGGVWDDDALVFCTGPDEQKARNIESNQHCAVTTGRNAIGEGLDVVVEGEAVRVTDDARLQRLADAWLAKYGDDWRFEVRDGMFHHDAGQALVFEVAATAVFGFAKGEQSSQTRWRF
jgi:pyridoxamine 5'-phosphate oxidase-like protein